MARSLIRNIQPRDVKKLFGNLSQTNYYQVDFSSLSTFGPNQELIKYLGERGVDRDFISRDAGLLCSEASLPGTSLATAEVKDNFMGVSQEFAHTRLYTDFDFTFYVDNDYKSIKFFEGWIDFISSGSETLAPIGDGANPLNSNYYRRMRYPDTYKCQTMTITKFERNVSSTNTIKYSFINVFPKTISAIPISYGGADILKVSVSFNYDRYAIDISGFSKGQQGRFTDITDKEKSLSSPAQPLQVIPYIKPVQSTVGNTAGPGTKFLPTDSATGYRGEGNPDGELLYPNGTPVYRPDGSMRNSQFDP